MPTLHPQLFTPLNAKAHEAWLSLGLLDETWCCGLFWPGSSYSKVSPSRLIASESHLAAPLLSSYPEFVQGRMIEFASFDQLAFVFNKILHRVKVKRPIFVEEILCLSNYYPWGFICWIHQAFNIICTIVSRALSVTFENESLTTNSRC